MIPALLLAAGKSTRMGTLKALLPAGPGDSFLTRILRTFADAGVERTIVVLGHEAALIDAHIAAAGLRPEIAINHAYESGQLSSLQIGLERLDQPDVEAMLLMLVDAPFVSAETVRAVVARYRQTGAPIVRPVRGDQHGHPVLITRALFPLLRVADPERGAKPIVRAHVSTAGDVSVDDAGAFMDIDTPDEYARVKGSLRTTPG